MTFDALMAARPWKPIRDCPGRYVLAPTAETPASLVGGDDRLHEHQLATVRDPIVIAPIAGGGIISYHRPDGRYVHTLNTPEGFARKLEQLGIAQ